jgi:hypothetical protein
MANKATPRNNPTAAPIPAQTDPARTQCAPLPTFPDDGTPDADSVIMEDDYIQIMMDVSYSMRAVNQLCDLLRMAHENPNAKLADYIAFAVMLEGVVGRLTLAVDGLHLGATKLGFGAAAQGLATDL